MTHQTNEEWLEEFDSMKVEKNEFWLKVLFEGEEKDQRINILNDAFQILKPYLKPFIEQALQAKDLQCQQEKVEIVERLYFGICDWELDGHCSDKSPCIVCKNEDWKQNTLKRLS